MNVETLPKVELHRHVEGALRYATMKEWVLADGLQPADAPEAQLRDFILIGQAGGRLEGVSREIRADPPRTVHRRNASGGWRSRPARTPGARASGCWNCAIRRCSSRGSARNWASTGSTRALLDGIAAAQKRYPLPVGLIGILGREWDLPTATRVTDFFIANRDTVVGLDLANDEANFGGKPFAGLFRKARNAGLRLTVHAGESAIPTSSESIRSALDDLGPSGSGTASRSTRIRPSWKRWPPGRHPGTMPHEQYPDEIHPTLESIRSGRSERPGSGVPQRGRSGVFDYDLNHEYRAMAELHGLTADDFAALNRDARAASFLPEADKSAFFRPERLARWLREGLAPASGGLQFSLQIEQEQKEEEMKKVLIPTALDSVAKEILEAHGGYAVTQIPKADILKFAKENPDLHALIVRSEKVTAEIIDAAPNLKVIVRAGAGYNTIDIAHARAKGVDVMNTPARTPTAWPKKSWP
jgi:hypothetical protein